MTEIICDTSPLQYLHQLGLLHLLPALVEKIIVPTAVFTEIETGRNNSVDLPDLSTLEWIKIRQAETLTVIATAIDLGAGETEVLSLALTSKNAVVILDDLLARKAADELGIKIIGTLGILLEAKRKNFLSEVKPILDELENLRFRLSRSTREAVLKLASENL